MITHLLTALTLIYTIQTTHNPPPQTPQNHPHNLHQNTRRLATTIDTGNFPLLIEDFILLENPSETTFSNSIILNDGNILFVKTISQGNACDIIGNILSYQTLTDIASPFTIANAKLEDSQNGKQCECSSVGITVLSNNRTLVTYPSTNNIHQACQPYGQFIYNYKTLGTPFQLAEYPYSTQKTIIKTTRDDFSLLLSSLDNTTTIGQWLFPNITAIPQLFFALTDYYIEDLAFFPDGTGIALGTRYTSGYHIRYATGYFLSLFTINSNIQFSTTNTSIVQAKSPRIAISNLNHTMIIFTAKNAQNFHESIYGKLLYQDHTTLKDTFIISNLTFTKEIAPYIIARPTGIFFATWISVSGNIQYPWIQIIDAYGELIYQNFRLPNMRSQFLFFPMLLSPGSNTLTGIYFEQCIIYGSSCNSALIKFKIITTSPTHEPTKAPLTAITIIDTIPTQYAQVGEIFIYELDVHNFFATNDGHILNINIKNKTGNTLSLPNNFAFTIETVNAQPTGRGLLTARPYQPNTEQFIVTATDTGNQQKSLDLIIQVSTEENTSHPTNQPTPIKQLLTLLLSIYLTT